MSEFLSTSMRKWRRSVVAAAVGAALALMYLVLSFVCHDVFLLVVGGIMVCVLLGIAFGMGVWFQRLKDLAEIETDQEADHE